MMTKDPPRLRRTRLLEVCNMVKPAMKASTLRLLTLDLNRQFATYYADIPCDEEYQQLLEDCRERYPVLQTGLSPCTFQEVLATSGFS